MTFSLFYSSVMSNERGIQNALITSDEFELEFPELSRAKLKRFRAKSSQAGAYQIWEIYIFFLLLPISEPENEPF